MNKELQEIVGNGKPMGSVLKETIAVSVTISISVQNRHSRIRLRVLSCNRMREVRREPEVPEERVPAEECFGCPARITSKELAPIHSVKNGTLQNACSTSRRMDADLGKSALMRIDRSKNSLVKGLKNNGDKSAVAMLKKGDWQERQHVTDQCHDRSGKPDERSDKKLELNSSQRRSSNVQQLGCVFQDMTPPKSILQKCTDMRKPIQRVKFTKAIARHTKIRDQNPSLGYICPGEPHERSPNAPKFQDRSQEETEWQEQGSREAAWKLAKNVLKLKKHERATFFSPSENRCLPASTLKPEEREFVVDSGASMHMISKEDLNDAEIDTLTKSCSPTIVITANGEVQTHEEAIVYVKELDIFLTMKVLDNTPAVLSLGKLCDENGYSYEWINGQKPHLIEDWIRIICNTENFVPIVVPGLSSSSSGSSSTSKTPLKQESHSSSSSSSSSSSPTVGEIQVRKREDATNRDISPVPVSKLVDDRTGNLSGDGILLSMTKIPPDDILEGLYKLRIRESDKLKTVLELYDLETHQKKLGPDYHRLKTMVKRSIEQEIRNKNFGARSGNFEKNAVVKNQETKQRVQRILGDCWQWETNGQCVNGDECSFRHGVNKRGKVTPSNPSPNSFMQQNERKSSRTRSPRGRSPSGRMSRWPCKDYLRGTCNNSFCEKWHPPECLFHKTKSGCRFGKSARMRIDRSKNSLVKGLKNNGDKSAVAMLKKGDWQERQHVTDQCHDRSGKPDERSDKKLELNSSQRRSSNVQQLGCVFQDMTPPKSILQKCTDMRKPIQRVKFTKAIARHTKIRDQNPSLGYICPGEPHERSPNAPKFEDRSQEETEWQEQGSREAAWKLAKNVLKLKKHERLMTKVQ